MSDPSLPRDEKNARPFRRLPGLPGDDVPITPMIRGWVEIAGEKIPPGRAVSLFCSNPLAAACFGGEFFIHGNGCMARDAFGIVPGDTPPGRIVCCGEVIGEVNPPPAAMDLEEAIIDAVRLRSDEGVVALSGGIDSTLIAVLAGLPCIAVGMAGSHDLAKAETAARDLGLECTLVTVQPGDMEEALHAVVSAIPYPTPVNVAIGITQYFIGRAAADWGHARVLTGQGADELFGGYARYLHTDDVDALLARDFASLRMQGERDQAIASLHGVLLSMPYLDLRVVRAAQALPADRKVTGFLRKVALREVAERYTGPDIAWAEKKAMQYGSGIDRELRRLAKRAGYSTVGSFLSASDDRP